VWAPPGRLPETAEWAHLPGDASWLRSLMGAGGVSHLVRSRRMQAAWPVLQLLYRLRRVFSGNSHRDLYHINWLQCALPLPADGKPVLITVLGNDLELLRLPLMTTLLRRSIRGRRVVICPNAEWMESPLRDAFGDLAAVAAVPFGIDADWYRMTRNLPTGGPARWLCVSRLTRNKLGDLFAWSESSFRGPERELHLIGPMQESVAIPDWVHYHGPASPDALLSRWFPSAAGLITLSRHAEGRPQVLLEGMAAGLPIIASNIPAHTALLEAAGTGTIVTGAADYASALTSLEDASVNARAGEAGRAWALREIGTWENCAERYCRHYHQLKDAPV